MVSKCYLDSNIYNGNMFENLIQINRLGGMLSWGFIVGRANQGKTGEGNGNFSVLHFWSDDAGITYLESKP